MAPAAVCRRCFFLAILMGNIGVTRSEGIFSSTGAQIRSGSPVAGRRGLVFSWLHCAAEDLFATVFPSDCRLCGQPLREISRLPVCPRCIDELPRSDGHSCGICGENLGAFDLRSGVDPARQGHFQGMGTPPAIICRMCRQVPPPYVRMVYYGDYEGKLRDLIHLLKYEKVQPASGVLGRLLWQVIASNAEFVRELSNGQKEAAEPWLVVPAPLHASRRRARGFNQAEEIAAVVMDFARRGSAPSSLPAVHWEMDAAMLVRTRPTETQTGKTNHQRRLNVRGAFAVHHPHRLQGRNVLLIDDVMTTGATISECARVLRRAGAATVRVATVARVLKTSIPKALSWENGERGADEMTN